MSTPPPSHPAYPQTPGPHQQTSGPYPQTPGPYAQTTGPYSQTTGSYVPAPGPYQQPSGPYPQTPGPYPQTTGPYQQTPGPCPPAAARPQQYGGGGMPAGGPAAACQVCGAAPAAPVTVRGHQGMVVVMRFLRRQGMLCRTCALASFRDMQADTMVMGWWGPLSALITPFTLLANLIALSGIRRIPAPVMPGWRPPLDPGKPVFRRPAGILALVPLALAGLVVLAVPVLIVIGMQAGPSESGGASDSGARTHPALTAGSCARNDADWPGQDLRPVACGSSDARFRVLEPDGGSCASGDYVAYPEYSRSGDISLCLHPMKG